ncbi:ABC transporter permease, partial [Streptococcus pseudopneumoniae]
LLVLFFCNYILKLGLKYSFPNIIWLFMILLLSSISLASIGLIISILSKNVKNTSVFGNLGNLLSTFLGGAFFPTDVWPTFLQPLVKVNPLTHMIAMLRSSLIYSDFVLSDIWDYTFYLVLMIVVCFVISFRYFTYEV